MRRFLRNNGLSIVLIALFLIFWAGQLVAGHRYHNEQQLDRGQPPSSFAEYLVSPNALEATMENWESEFLAIGSMVIFSIYLRQKGSPESKPVDAPHDQTAE